MLQFINFIHDAQIWKQTSRKMVMVAKGQVQGANLPTTENTIIVALATLLIGLRNTGEAHRLVD